MDLGLTERVAIVAAASKGLGLAVAQELAREGAHAAICARTAGTVAQTARDIQKCSGREIFHQAPDVTDSSAVGAFVSAVEVRFGRIDICVTNSGGPPSNSFKNTKPEDWRSAVDQLLMSTILFARENFAAHAKKQVGTSDYHYFFSGEEACGWPAAFRFLTGTSIAVDGGLVKSLL